MLCAPNQPLMWMLLTVAVMPSLRRMATTCAMASGGRWVNSLWSMAMSVSRPGESCASNGTGHLAQHARRHLLHAGELGSPCGRVLLVYF